MSGLSLWLSPPPTSALRPLIKRLAKDNSSESFLPHATLVSDEIVPKLPVEELVKKVEAGLNEWKKTYGGTELELRFKDVRQGNRYYQCVLTALFEDEPLLSLHHSIVRQFDLTSPPNPYFPHLSLVYADLTLEVKASIIKGLEEDKTVVYEEGEEGAEVAGEKGFRPEEILLLKTAGPCETWEVLARIPL
ncbi:hypothetical protein JCM8547_008734 [Rhodosporidiobolus lusitaniae]